jgi:hypothetical protein
VFATESCIGIMASALGVYPLGFRLRILVEARMIRVLEAAAAKLFKRQADAVPAGQ